MHVISMIRAVMAQWVQRLRRTTKKTIVQVNLKPFKAKDSRFYELFSEPRKLKRIASGFQFTEGPIWISESQYLLFSDIPANTIYQLSPEGKVSVFRKPSGNSNGLTRDRQGRLIVCEHSNRQVTRTEPDGSITVLADCFEGKKLNSPNDVVVKRDGSIYFSDPPYGIQPQEQEQPVQGIYRIAPTGGLTLVCQDFDRPNGLAFSPAEDYLYIDDSARQQVRIFKVQPNGELSDTGRYYNLLQPAQGVPDGMKVDQAGRLYCTGPGGIWIFTPDGTHLGTVSLPEPPTNCAWGDRDGCGLYITATTSIYKLRVRTPGILPASPFDSTASTLSTGS